MEFLEFIRNNFTNKYEKAHAIELVKASQDNVDEVQVENEVEESEADKITNELMSVSYRRSYVFPGYCRRDIEVNGQRIRYKHYEYFLADDDGPHVRIENVIKLTGDNIDGKPIPYTGFSFCRSTNLVFRIDEEQWTLDDDHLTEKDFNKQYIPGYELAERAKDLNNGNINLKLKELAEQEDVDAMFRK